MKRAKKLFGLLLAFCMVLSLLPVSGSASSAYTYKQRVRTDEYDGGGRLVGYTTVAYNADGQPVEEQIMELGEDGAFAETYYCMNTYNQFGNLEKAEYRAGGENWTDTYFYQYLTHNTYRTITTRMPENVTTVSDDVCDDDGNFVRNTTMVDNVLTSETTTVYNTDAKLRYDVTNNYSDEGETLDVLVFDDEMGDMLCWIQCDDLDDIKAERKTDALNKTTEITISGGDVRNDNYYADGFRTKSETLRGADWRNVTTYDINGNILTDEYWYDGVLGEKDVYAYDEEGYPTKLTNTDGDGTIQRVYVFTYQEFVIPGANMFDDVSEADYFYDAVDWAVISGITQGTGEGTFSPDMTCTRGQIVTLLWRAAGQPLPETSTSPFSDVSPDDYYYNAVLWAVESGITSGTGNGMFSPGGECTRSQVVTFLYRFAGSPAVESTDNPFADVPSDAYYCSAVLWAVENGITQGTGVGLFSPEMVCTRGQIVTFLYRDLA